MEHRLRFPYPLLVALCLWAFLTMAQAQQPPSAADVQRALALLNQAAAAKAPAGARIQVLAGTADPRLKLAPCDKAEPFFAAGAPAWGRTRVGLRCAEGAVRWTIYLPATVQVWAPAAATRAPLPAGSVLAESDLVLTATDWAAAPSPVLATVADAVGRTLARAAAPGQALRQADLRARKWFASGEPVDVVAAGAGYAVSTSGRALAVGIDGQPVRVVTDDGRTLVGKAVGPRRVELAL
jgi:flagella basal body P-ring formation protein FlgA